MSNGNGSERLDQHGGRRLTIPGVGLVEIIDGDPPQVITLEPLSPEMQQRLDMWMEHEWPKVQNSHGGY